MVKRFKLKITENNQPIMKAYGDDIDDFFPIMEEKFGRCRRRKRD